MAIENILYGLICLTVTEIMLKKKLNLATIKNFIKVPSFLLEAARGTVLMQKTWLYSFCCISLVTSVFKKVNCRR